MLDNFDLIKEFLGKNSSIEENDFYIVQILKRKKENPEMKKDVSLIDSFFIYSLSDFDKLKDKIINLCNFNNARAYIRLNKRNNKKISLQTLKVITDCIINENYNEVKNAYLSACGQFSSEKNKKWMIDLDDKELLTEVITFLETITYILEVIPSKNGYHLIVSGFNPNLFTNKYPNITFHKEAMVILYC